MVLHLRAAPEVQRERVGVRGTRVGLQTLLDDCAHGCDARAGADADERGGGVGGEGDEALLQADLERVPRLEREEPGRADAAARDLEHGAVVDDGDAEVDAARVGA